MNQTHINAITTSEQDFIPRIVIPWLVCADTNARNADTMLMGRSGTIYQVTSEQDLIPRIVIP